MRGDAGWVGSLVRLVGWVELVDGKGCDGCRVELRGNMVDGWGGGGGGGGGLHSHFRVQPNYSVEVVVICRGGCDNNGAREITHPEDTKGQ